MGIRNINSAEAWEKIYEAFNNVNFTAFDYDTVKQSLIDYLKIYYKEHFNDFIESSEFIAFLGIFAYFAELLAYRIDVNANENFITTAQRKQTLLKLAKIISYKVSRNIPARGLVKISSISTTEEIFDSQGNNLQNIPITWNDPNNGNWKEQFFLVLDRALTGKIGQPQKSFQINDVAMQMYTFNNDLSSFRNGVFPYSVDTGLEQIPMEIVPVDLDNNGPLEKSPDSQSKMTLLYSVDGAGDASDYTGFMMFTKQGALSKIEYAFNSSIPNRTLDVNLNDINEIDVWLYKVDSNENITEVWEKVETVNEENLIFNTVKTRKKYEVETLENNKIRLIFGAGDFSDIPLGDFRIWVRQSQNSNVIIQKNKIVNQGLSFTYTSSIGRSEQVNLTFSSVSVIQNSSEAETIDRIRSIAPSTYYAQNRMVNGQDYNTYPLKDQTILKLQTINRTFAGQPKYIDWHDASGTYENVKIFGDDLNLHYRLSINTVNTTLSSRSLIDSVIEPILQTPNIQNVLTHISATSGTNSINGDTRGVISVPRRKFIEDNRKIFSYFKYDDIIGANVLKTEQPLLEKTAIQGALDRHWYGEPLEYVVINNVVHAKILDPVKYPSDDSKIYDDSIPRTLDGINSFPPGDPGSGLQPISSQPKFGLRFIRTIEMVGDGTCDDLSIISSSGLKDTEVWTLEFSSDRTTIFVTSNLRGSFPNAVVNVPYLTTNPSAPINFIITQGTALFENGDAFILKIDYNTNSNAYTISNPFAYNLSGRWEIINGVDLGTDPNSLPFDPDEKSPASWLIWVETLTSSNVIVGHNIHFRELKLIAESEKKHTKFWFNAVDQMLDSDTQNRVFDKIKVLRSNLDANGKNLIETQNYDVVGAVKDSNGNIDIYSLEVIPSDTQNLVESGDGVPDNILQFENFSSGKFKFFDVSNPSKLFDSIPTGWLNKIGNQLTINDFNNGAFIDQSGKYGRYEYRGLLDFMWQHFSPNTNMIDPSPTNIHDAFILTKGYYENMMSFVQGRSSVQPVAPTPLELRNSFGYLFEKKMLSDTVIMHPGKIRLLFGEMAEPQLKAKFKIVKLPNASYSDERIKLEVVTIINDYFNINNWDFGQKFYATDLTSAIHKVLATQIATIVPVPVYSVNSFGSLFVIEPGFDEILQSCATISDIEIVTDLTPTIMRQKI